jgi:hypothetical protein
MTHQILKFCILVPLAFSTNAHAGIFGPSNYEECVLSGLKDAKNEVSTQLLNKVCREKFQREPEKKINKDCFITWNGKNFVSGRPENTPIYTKIVFKGTSDAIFIPSNLMDTVNQEFVLRERATIKSICPNINLDQK